MARSLVSRQPRSVWDMAAEMLEADVETVVHFERPSDLVRVLDPKLVITPALMVLDDALVEVEKAVAVMAKRRRLFREGIELGLDEETALEVAVESVPQEGITRLIVSMPPQEGKSTWVGRYGMLWLLRCHPWLHIATISYQHDVVRRMTGLIRGDIEAFNGADGAFDLGLRLDPSTRSASWFKLAWPDVGDVYGTGIRGGLTSRPVDLLNVDDPVKDWEGAESAIRSERTFDWWDTVGSTRLPSGAPVILTLTRWSQKDLAGRFLERQAEAEKQGKTHFDRWHVINIPAQADHDPEKGETDPLGREPGEWMASARGRTRDDWLTIQGSKSPRVWYALYQGKPTPGEGDVFERSWWKRYGVEGVPTPYTVDEDGKTYRVLNPKATLIQSWDCAFKDRASSDYVCGGVWCKIGSEVYLLDVVVAHLSFTKTLAAILLTRRKWPQARTIIIEDKANGTAVIDMLRKRVGSVIAENPKESKVARAEAVAPFAEAGNIWLPIASDSHGNPVAHFDVEAFIEEATVFPQGAHDDQVDMMTQALKRLLLRPGQGAVFAEAWQRELAKKKPVDQHVGQLEVDDDADEVLAELRRARSRRRGGGRERSGRRPPASSGL